MPACFSTHGGEAAIFANVFHSRPSYTMACLGLRERNRMRKYQLHQHLLSLLGMLLLVAAVALAQSPQPTPQKPDISSTKKTGNAQPADAKTDNSGPTAPPANPAANSAKGGAPAHPAPRFDIANI